MGLGVKLLVAEGRVWGRDGKRVLRVPFGAAKISS